MGVQSFEASTLTTLGRAHDGPTAERAFAAARAAGFDNVSMDFIYGVHGQTRGAGGVGRARGGGAGLGAPLGVRAHARQGVAGRRGAAGEAAGARRGVRCRPTRRWCACSGWCATCSRGRGSSATRSRTTRSPASTRGTTRSTGPGGEYLAVGTGATGYLRARSRCGTRTSAARRSTWSRWRQGRLPEASREALTALELFEERVAMGLRLVNGVALEAVCEAFGQSAEARAQTVTAPGARRAGRAARGAAGADRRGLRRALGDRGAD